MAPTLFLKLESKDSYAAGKGSYETTGIRSGYPRTPRLRRAPRRGRSVRHETVERQTGGPRPEPPDVRPAARRGRAGSQGGHREVDSTAAPSGIDSGES